MRVGGRGVTRVGCEFLLGARGVSDGNAGLGAIGGYLRRYSSCIVRVYFLASAAAQRTVLH